MKEPKEMTAEQAFQRLSALCAQAEHCQYEMLEKMRAWGMDDEAQASVMERLVSEHYVDDERYCRAFVRDKIRYNKWGRRKVEQALWMKHIDDDIRRSVLDEIDENEYISVLRPMLQQKRKSVRVVLPRTTNVVRSSCIGPWGEDSTWESSGSAWM